MPCLDSPEYYIMYGKKLSLKPALPVLILLKIKRLALFFLNSLPPFAAASAFCIWNVSLACRPVIDQWINSCLCQSLHHRPSKSVCLSQDLLTAALGWGLNVQRVIDQNFSYDELCTTRQEMLQRNIISNTWCLAADWLTPEFHTLLLLLSHCSG